MAAIANLVLADGQNTPVNKTFVPMDANSGLATWTDRSGGISIGMPVVTMSVTMGAEVNKIKAKVALPVLEVISGADGGYTPSPKVAYTCSATVDFNFPNRATLQNRKDIRAFIRNMMSDAIVQKAVEEFERPY